MNTEECTFETTGTLPLLLLTAAASILMLFGISACGDQGCESDHECAGDRQCEIATGQCLDVNGDGSDGGDSSSDDGGNSSSNGGDADDIWCCPAPGDEFYECKDEDAGMACFEDGDLSGCERNASRDDECNGNGGGSDENGGGDGNGDFGDMCTGDDDCMGICVWENPNDSAGFCTETCDNWSDCPSFWSCEELADAPQDVCVED